MPDNVVIFPCTVLCPSCAMVTHRSGYMPTGEPPPLSISVRGLNSRCPEYKVNKRLALQVVPAEVEVPHVEPD